MRGAILLLYLALLVASNLVRARVDNHPELGQRQVELPAYSGVTPEPARTTRIAWREWPGSEPAALPVVLVHGSPGDGASMVTLAEALSGRHRRLAPDLPGFGGSSLRAPDYSVRAHAATVAALLDHLRLPRVHLIVHSMGGGVALELYRQRPELVASTTLLGAVGVVELELLGNHALNHGIHGLQLGLIRAVTWGLPHFGALDRFPLNVAYARNFYDTDQRPLRDVLRAYSPPMLIVQGERDTLVPAAAAREHARLVPQSELVLLPSDHFFVFRPDEADEVAARVDAFLEAVEQGRALTRADAEPARTTAAAMPFDPRSLPPTAGIALLTLGALLALATLVSEDGACIAAGLLAASGRMSFFAGTLACFTGILVGDLLLFLVGRWLGRPALRRPPMSWWVSEAAVDRASAWYRRNGASLIFTSRFMPGMRLPMYVAAGALRTPFRRFAIYFALAAGVWTPLLVGAAALLGARVETMLGDSPWALPALIAAAVLLLVVVRALVPLSTHRGRRLALGAWRRLTRWEFWPMWLFYPPVVLSVARLAVQHRSLTLFTAVNPGIPAGGFIGESKWDIYQALGGETCVELPKTARLLASEPADRRIATARAFMSAHGLSWPVVLKPDAGQRGFGVAIVRGDEQLEDYLRATGTDTLVQEHIAGVEYGLFYVRRPSDPRGFLFSITHKKPLDVFGDGRRTLEELILDDDRAVCMAPTHLARHSARGMEVPAQGERVRLVEIGTHSRGAVFLDGAEVRTPALEAAVDRLSQGFRGGFYFGRYDVRASDTDALRAGRFKIIELNGATSEAVHIYDPKNTVTYAWRVLREQWRLCYEIAAANAAAGAKVSTIRELMDDYRGFRHDAAGVPKG